MSSSPVCCIFQIPHISDRIPCLIGSVKNLLAMQEIWVQTLVGKIPWRRKWQPTPVFLPGEFCEQRNLVGYSPWSPKELDTIEGLTFYKWYQTVFLFSISLISLQVPLWVLQDGTWLQIFPGTSPLIQPQSKMTMEVKEKVLVVHSCMTLCHPVDCSPPGSSVHGILQARILEWVAVSFSRGSSQSRGWTWVSSIAGRFLTIWATGEVTS